MSDVSRDLPVVLAKAMHSVMRELDTGTLYPTSLTVALLADYLIEEGYPATVSEGADDPQST